MGIALFELLRYIPSIPKFDCITQEVIRKCVLGSSEIAMSISLLSKFLLLVINRNSCEMSSKFLYFAYGSNLLAQRLHINNPSAVRVTTGRLDNFRLDFGTVPSKSWGGSPATIVPDDSSHCWGAVWEIDSANLPNLDRQEGVHVGLYFPLNVTVTSPEGVNYDCRTYQLVKTPPALEDGELPPMEGRPSYIYLQVILQGARESGLPEDYIRKLEKIVHNGYTGNVDIPVQITVGNYVNGTVQQNSSIKL